MKISPFASLPSIQTHFTSPTLFAFSYPPLFKPYLGALLTAAVYDNHGTLTLVTDRKLSLVPATGTFTTGRPPRTVLLLHVVFKENFPIATLPSSHRRLSYHARCSLISGLPTNFP